MKKLEIVIRPESLENLELLLEEQKANGMMITNIPVSYTHLTLPTTPYV